MPKNPEAPGHVLDEGTWNQFVPSDPATPADDSSDRKSNASGHSVGPNHEGPSTIPVPQPTSTPHTRHDRTNPAAPDSADSDEVTPKPGSERSDEWDLLPAPKIEKGQILFGKYLLEEKLGEGGMGQVWRVENVMLQRESALKLIRPEIAQNDKGWKRFEREARLMAMITHHNAVGVYDFRRSHSMGYIEMELVPGISLHDFLKQRNGEPLPLAWITQFLDQLCSVLQEAHGHVDKKSGKSRPIIHRDLKPSNLMLVEGKPADQNLKVLDFGIAKIAEDEGNPELTVQGDFLGTPDYMSPEQIRGGITKEGRGGIDGRSDLYAVGVLLYQLLTGSLPFKAMNKMGVLAAHLYSTVPAMKDANPGVRVLPQVERLVVKCMEKDPDKRPQTARELAQQFRAAIGVPETTEPERPRSRSLAPPIVAACLLTAVLIFVGPRILHLVGSGRSTVQSELGEVSESHNGTTDKGSTDPSKPEAESTKSELSVWLPAGYEVAEPFEPAPDAADETMRIRRISDHIELYRLKPGVYLPLGYEPESIDMSDLEEGWPRVIVRSSAKQVRFIRLAGKTYLQGDGRSGTPARDTSKNPCTPHWVRMSGFYIQETEVTHEEIEKYLETHPEAAENLRTWDAYHKRLCKTTKPVEKAKTYPAVCISYFTARKFAQDMGGRLPTEAEWEFAAKSCNDNSIFPWGSKFPAKGSKPKANIQDPSGFAGLAAVKTFPEDKTDQYVFDIAGNVRELCLDAYGLYSNIINAGNSTKDPLHDPCVRVEPRPDAATKYVVRGGSFLLGLQRAMVFQRDTVPADNTTDDIGFRLVIECPPAR
jgi:eukaryotic-like serine/threonine-protein kinase